MTRAEHEKWAKAIWEEAYRADPYHTEALTSAILGRDVFAWSALTVAQIRALSSALFATALAGRG